MAADITKAAEFWSKGAEKATHQGRGVSWLELTAVRQHINQRVSGCPKTNWLAHALRQYRDDRPPLEHCLSLGCGEGRLERELSQLGAFHCCDAFDVAPGAIALAKLQAAEQGIGNINYAVADINTLSLPPHHYDAVWVDMALHHFDQLEQVYRQIWTALKPDGYLIFNEYIGPNRFQFPQRQKEIVNLCLALIPEQYRVAVQEFAEDEQQRSPGKKGMSWLAQRFLDKLRDGDLLGVLQRRFERYRQQVSGKPLERTRISFPTERDLIAADPTEAVRSSEILSKLEGLFEIVEYRPWGGNILHFLLGGIAGNFRPENEGSLELLDALIHLEDALIACGELEDDFAYVVARPLR